MVVACEEIESLGNTNVLALLKSTLCAKNSRKYGAVFGAVAAVAGFATLSPLFAEHAANVNSSSDPLILKSWLYGRLGSGTFSGK